MIVFFTVVAESAFLLSQVATLNYQSTPLYTSVFASGKAVHFGLNNFYCTFASQIYLSTPIISLFQNCGINNNLIFLNDQFTAYGIIDLTNRVLGFGAVNADITFDTPKYFTTKYTNPNWVTFCPDSDAALMIDSTRAYFFIKSDKDYIAKTSYAAASLRKSSCKEGFLTSGALAYRFFFHHSNNYFMSTSYTKGSAGAISISSFTHSESIISGQISLSNYVIVTVNGIYYYNTAFGNSNPTAVWSMTAPSFCNSNAITSAFVSRYLRFAMVSCGVQALVKVLDNNFVPITYQATDQSSVLLFLYNEVSFYYFRGSSITFTSFTCPSGGFLKLDNFECVNSCAKSQPQNKYCFDNCPYFSVFLGNGCSQSCSQQTYAYITSPIIIYCLSKCPIINLLSANCIPICPAKSNGICSCTLSTFYQASYSSCLVCHFLCNTCTGRGSSLCLSCYDARPVTENGCSCSVGQFQSFTQRTCLPCIQNCDQCLNAASCIQCHTTFLLISGACLCYSAALKINNKCMCPIGQYLEPTFFNNCVSCNPTCNTCSGSLPNNCLSCKPGYSYISLDSRCICNVGQVLLGSICTPCGAGCQNCDLSLVCNYCYDGMEIVDQACSCPSGKFIIASKCKSCYPSCRTCTNSLKYTCLACVDNYFLSINQCRCVSSMYEQLPGRCRSCVVGCLMCVGSSQFCLLCTSVFSLYKNVCTCSIMKYNDNAGRCQFCSLGCGTCINSQICLLCVLGNSLSQRVCVCLPGTYQNNIGECIACFQICTSCFSGGSSECLSCQDGYQFSNGNCVCKIGTYKQKQFCLSCYITCASCFNGDEYGCLTCARNAAHNSNSLSCECVSGTLLYQGSCLPCTFHCQACSGTPSNCTRCDQKTTLNKAASCDCVSSTYIDTITKDCIYCSSACATCYNSTICYSCNQPLIYSYDSCYCPFGYDYNSEAGVCVRNEATAAHQRLGLLLGVIVLLQGVLFFLVGLPSSQRVSLALTASWMVLSLSKNGSNIELKAFGRGLGSIFTANIFRLQLITYNDRFMLVIDDVSFLRVCAIPFLAYFLLLFPVIVRELGRKEVHLLESSKSRHLGEVLHSQRVSPADILSRMARFLFYTLRPVLFFLVLAYFISTEFNYSSLRLVNSILASACFASLVVANVMLIKEAEFKSRLQLAEQTFMLVSQVALALLVAATTDKARIAILPVFLIMRAFDMVKFTKTVNRALTVCQLSLQCLAVASSSLELPFVVLLSVCSLLFTLQLCRIYYSAYCCYKIMKRKRLQVQCQSESQLNRVQNEQQFNQDQFKEIFQ